MAQGDGLVGQQGLLYREGCRGHRAAAAEAAVAGQEQQQQGEEVCSSGVVSGLSGGTGSAALLF